MDKGIKALLDILLAEGNCSGDKGFLELEIEDQISTCGTCPVIAECREYARAIRATETVYGGYYYPSKYWRLNR